MTACPYSKHYEKKYVDGRHLNNTREILHGGYFMFFGQVCQKLSAFGA